MAWLIDDPALAQKALCDLVGDESLLSLTVNDLDDAYCEWVSENSEDGQTYPAAWDALGPERQEELVDRAKTVLGNLPWGDTLRSLFDAWKSSEATTCDGDRCQHGMFYSGAGACPACSQTRE
jgi:hypothetical protein